MKLGCFFQDEMDNGDVQPLCMSRKGSIRKCRCFGFPSFSLCSCVWMTDIEQASESHSSPDAPTQDDDGNCCRWCMDYISLRSVFPAAIIPLKQAQSIRRHYPIRDQAHPEGSPALESIESGTVDAGAGVP
ncbi:hypothetical protein CBR_g38012 [Chara braunii]|uniref:Uncharacterized protein n=1 Tax=Chara braunii TaxID=69332 RepID=A0A388JZZ5_CHABU|nr:hypothetical protein CBR_g38012 [Chara braunii]|eukprot:GBG63390.1 hypothetical protein CBR_g38012 [Chara braunii]